MDHGVNDVLVSEQDLYKRLKEQRNNGREAKHALRILTTRDPHDEEELASFQDETVSTIADHLATAHHNQHVLASHDFPHHASNRASKERSLGITTHHDEAEAAAAPPPPADTAWEWDLVTAGDDNDASSGGLHGVHGELHYSLPTGLGTFLEERKDGRVCKAEDMVRRNLGSRLDHLLPPPASKTRTVKEIRGVFDCETHREKARRCIRLCGVCYTSACLDTGTPADVQNEEDEKEWRKARELVCDGQCWLPECTQTCKRFVECRRFPAFPAVPHLSSFSIGSENDLYFL